MDEDYFCRVRKRLHSSGVITSSRSALNHGDSFEFDDDYVIDVGEGKRPNFTEQLLAHLEQHGLRRCYADEDDFAEFTASPEVVHEEAQETDHDETTSTLSKQDDARRAYFYICVPCEIRLTKVYTHAATHNILEDAHYHFSSAAHRSTASWMADPDIDVTLSNSPLVDITGYTRIFVNGVPMLLSRRPGGGDMFYPLPHEQERFNPHNKVVRRAPPPHHVLDSISSPHEEMGAHKNKKSSPLYPSLRYSSNANYWYRPLTSTYCRRTRQIVSRFEGTIEHALVKWKTPFHQLTARRRIQVNQVRIQSLKSNLLVDSSVMPTIPALYPILRRRIAKKFLECSKGLPDPPQAPVEPYRVQYIQPYQPYLFHSDTFDETHTSNDETSKLDRFIVESEGVYRIGLLSENELKHLEHERDLLDVVCYDLGTSSLAGGGQQTEFVTTAPLTQEMLSQLTQSSPFSLKQPNGHENSSMGSYGSSSLIESTPPSSISC
ncbi:unnamed protein product [Phytomonas sp. Hart1]|nr:unnamed protein product [Phytomonas sp. Hart1]|eukprot:CCW71103.1 unnamed protein product [Phytomonas sp. isolate Hart1]